MSSIAGRRPMPEQWRQMTGNAGKRPLGETAAVAFRAGAPALPDHLDEAAVAEWQRIVPELQTAGLLATVDGAALAMYCTAYSRWRKAELRIQAMDRAGDVGAGMVARTPNGFEQLNYWLIVSNKAQEQLLRYLAEFGLSPTARARVRQLDAGQGDLFGNDPLGAYLRAGAAGPAAA